MKNMVLSVIWLAIAGLFTTMTMSACSDDDENNSSNLTPYDDYWLLRCYAVKDGQTHSIPLMN